jgi:hypothetical protein
MLEQKIHNSFLLCSFALVMLVMTGIGITLFIDSRVTRIGLEEKVLEQRQKITELEQLVGSLEEKQAGVDFLAQIEQDKLSDLETQKHALLASLKNLSITQRDAAVELESVEKEFSTYQAKMRKLIWFRSVGYRFGSLTLDYGITYDDVRIAEISEFGVKIVHDGGTSLIPSNSMPAFLQEKFQLVLTTASYSEGTVAP